VGVGGVTGLPETTSRLGRDQLLQTVRSVRLVQPGEAFAGRTVAVVETSIEDVLGRCNGDSQNLYAEAMIKRIGHEVTKEPGSWTNGSSIIRMTLGQNLGADAAAGTVIADGSGMSRDDRVAPHTLTRWLDRLQRDATLGPIFIQSLATPEHRESLKRRFHDVRLSCDLHAKTGTIDGVRCLSGYLIDPTTNHRVAFSVMVNDLKEGEQALNALQFHEDVVALADKWLAARRPTKEAASSRVGQAPG
jgi:D-alanyl-D-alanine carboxypeptidase/D-alanyl-D-alanine-endopeptidase (penicillin-binding protein 4)